MIAVGDRLRGKARVEFAQNQIDCRGSSKHGDDSVKQVEVTNEQRVTD